jgi:hypothetical protein
MDGALILPAINPSDYAFPRAYLGHGTSAADLVRGYDDTNLNNWFVFNRMLQ